MKTNSKKLRFDSVKESRKYFSRLGSKLRGGEVIEFVGDLGSGKTTLTKAIAKGAGYQNEGSSPSFTISNEYRVDKFTIYHFDFFRISQNPGIIKYELNELFNNKDVVIIEWADSVLDILPNNKIKIQIKVLDLNSREIELENSPKFNYLFN
ncbi:MAG: tRNA (adenosine(37)-N6)-threonylcarbamoyltransferase complex ATPase subunit type 1 TsaE [Patescibacteria group bacterium]|nr:tRNA (adenosine(37)-N6)-threonylcarbamoyltransferase complex ATPase subunit type 1 TsaE [Patescibacteria group bacterium]